MGFLDELRNASNETLTANGDLAYKSSLDPVLDYFGLAGAMRSRPDESATLFQRAFIADPGMAVRALFYMRDIRGGQGERDVFLAGLRKLAEIDPKVHDALLDFVPEYGRWSDLFVDGINDAVVSIVAGQLNTDEAAMAKGESVSLLAKWMPSENTSSLETRNKARELALALGMEAKEYRQRVVALRRYISLLEQQMSANNWSEIDYSKVPSQAFRKHVKAFGRHDQDRFAAFLDAASKGEVKLNTSTLYTYEVYRAVQRGDVAAADAMWANLPDYTSGRNALVMADVSGSMDTADGMPMATSVSLALYFAERNQGLFNGYFMTFSGNPQLVQVQGNTLSQRMAMIEQQEWGMNTDLIKALLAVLEAAVRASAPQEELPSILYVISDMQFDNATSGRDWRSSEETPKVTTLDVAKREFERAGYTLPHVVFWNVNAMSNQLPATMFDNAVTLLSGSSQSTFRYAVEGKTPQEFMIEVLTSERYAPITI